MAQIFHPSTNTVSKVSIVVLVLTLATLFCVLDVIGRSPYFTQVNVAVTQPVPFSHKHHVEGLGLDCRYCHTSVEDSSFAGIPPTKTCMNCHSEIWKDSPMLEPVRESFKSNRSLEWIRVHDLPDYVFFNHSIHVNKGIGCTTCHGPVDQMPLTWRVNTLNMGWCLECHRAPEKFVRPRDEVFNVSWTPPANQIEAGRALVEEYRIGQVNNLENCSVCHR
jgi:hypothetical protein